MFALDSLVRNAVQQSVNVLHPENAPAPLDSAIHLEPYPFEVLKPSILLPKLFWPTVRKNCSRDQENLLEFEAEGREFAKCLWSLEQFIQTVKGQNNFC